MSDLSRRQLMKSAVAVAGGAAAMAIAPAESQAESVLASGASQGAN